MHVLDWLIIIGFVGFALAIGLAMTGKASKSLSDFYVAGRSLPWWAAGTSLVATSFSADTPLFVAGLVRSEGVFGNWFWWAGLFAAVATVFFFCRLWRRLDILTDLEFLAVRYEPSRAMSALRVFRVFYDGILINCIIMASVTVAASKITQVMLDLPTGVWFELPLLGPVTPTAAVMVGFGLVALVYTALSGLYGVVYTDLVQFVMAMVGAITLAVIAWAAAAENGPVMEQIASLPDFRAEQTALFPSTGSHHLVLFTFIVYIGVSWWGGAPGNGFAIQRLLATRSERDSMLAFLWYAVCHFVIRPWPWIIVGLISMLYFPNLADPEQAYPLMIDKFLPIGLKGMMIASLLAAFMSTLDTHLNWGSSYLINDLYKPYLKPGRSERHYVSAARWSMVLLTIAMLITTSQIQSILGAAKYLGVMAGGVGLVMIARWYWWRVNVYSEISAMLTSLVVGNVVALTLPDFTDADGVFHNYFGWRLVINLTVCTAVWVAVTLLTQTPPTPQVREFMTRSGVGGWGWRRVAQDMGVEQPPFNFGFLVAGWAAGCLFILGLLLGIGEAIFQRTAPATIYLGVAVVAGVLLITVFTKAFRNPLRL